MWTWLLPLLGTVGKWIWHSICRFWSVFLVGAVILIIVMRFHSFKNDIYDSGYKKGYSQALTEHPTTTVQAGGTSITNIGDKVKSAGIEIDGFGFGFWHRRQS